MKRIDLSQVIAILANVGVILGIAFLALELQQNTTAIQASTYQSLSNSAVDQVLGVSHDPQLSDLLVEVYQQAGGDDFTLSENNQLFNFYRGTLLRLENTYIQFRNGLVSDDVFDSYGWEDGIFGRPHFAYYWCFIGRGDYSSDFREFFKNRMMLPECSDGE